MLITCETPKLVIVDDVLPEEAHMQLWNVLAKEGQNPIFTQKWSKIWSFGSDMAWSSPAMFYSREKDRSTWPTLLGRCFLKVAEEFPKHVRQGWDDVRLHFHMFGRGTKLRWHVDNHSGGSFTYYPHPEWKPSWGGEMLVAEMAAPLAEGEKITPSFDWQYENSVLTAGVGNYIVPKPNRLVLLAPGVFHSTVRVDSDAGDALRYSIVGFLVKNSETKLPELPKDQSEPEVKTSNE